MIKGIDHDAHPVVGAYTENGGFIKGVNLLPIICDISQNVYFENQTYTASPCSTACANSVTISNNTYTATEYEVVNAKQTITSPDVGESLRFNLGATGVFRSGNTISLKPGFRARRGSSFRALIRNCNSSPGSPGCNIAARQFTDLIEKDERDDRDKEEASDVNKL